MIDKSNGGGLNFLYLVRSRRTYVDQQYDRKRLFRRAEITDLLLDTVFKDLKIRFMKITNVKTTPVGNGNGDSHQTGFDFDHFPAVGIDNLSRNSRRIEGTGFCRA